MPIAPFAAYAQTDQPMDGKFNARAGMKITKKDRTINRADVMKIVSEKFDKMQKGSMIFMDQMEEMLKDLYHGY